ncbi:hypothetical protein [Oleiagrimonas sp. C23AA]|uniref:flavodoxin family protein n=1 Tax=Oleiagrimonas sp. C23AA TaxID=2719047 RepID=UPI001421C791|nr:hypothetical protein [Oleiagrimonas sp. C23AA]NII11089.1 hypothetical protein [Oleiagrimonas sp. C23AA]
MHTDAIVICYSMTGHTRTLAGEIAEALDAPLIDIHEPRRRRGLYGVTRALFDAIGGRLTPIVAPSTALTPYRVVVLGGPVWAGRMAAPVRRFARDYGAQCSNLACFCSLGGSSAERAFHDIEQLSGQNMVATLAVDAKHLAPPEHAQALQAFLGSVRSFASRSQPR